MRAWAIWNICNEIDIERKFLEILRLKCSYLASILGRNGASFSKKETGGNLRPQ
jgi:hypothetical protein